MCGIMGYFCWSDVRPEKRDITNMFSLLESRGRDASGYGFIKDGKLVIVKDAVRSSKLVESKEWDNLIMPKVFIAHTRLKTQGSEKHNVNNHPIFSKNGIAIVHNGMIHNDKEIFAHEKRDGQVDSEAILSVFSEKTKTDKIKRVFDRLEGSFAFAGIDKNDPDKLVLVKKDNPLCLYLDTKAEIIYFCSERSIMQEALNIRSKVCRGFNVGEYNYHYFEMENNHGLVLSNNGVESYKKYTPKTERWYPRYMRDDFEIVTCPFCYEQTFYDEGKLNNRCHYCGNDLTTD